MEKTEAVKKLRKAGYQVQFDSSVVIVLLTPKCNRALEIRKIRSFLREIGYQASFGVRQLKEVSGEEEFWEQENSDLMEMEEEEQEKEIEQMEQFSLEDFGIL